MNNANLMAPSTKKKNKTVGKSTKKTRPCCPSLSGFSALNKGSGCSVWVAIALALAAIGATVGVLFGLHVFSSSSSSSSSSSVGNLVYYLPLRTGYTDVTGNTLATPIDANCAPTFTTTVQFPNSQYGTSWYNPCNTNDQGIAVTGTTMPASFTLAGVFNPTSVNSNSVIVFYGSGQTPGTTFVVEYNIQSGAFNGLMANGVFFPPIGFPLSFNVWTHLVITYDAVLGVTRLYINGQPVGVPYQVAADVMALWSNNVRSLPVIGGFTGGDYDFTGHTYNQLLSSSVISADQASQLYNNDVNSPGNTYTVVTSTGSNNNGMYSSPTWYNDPTLLNYYYPLTNNLLDVTQHTTAAIADTTQNITSSCVPFFSNNAYYNPCDTWNQGLIITGNGTSPSFTLTGMFKASPAKSTNIFMLVGSNRASATGLVTPLGYTLQFDLTNHDWESAITYYGFFVNDVPGTFTLNVWYHVAHSFDGVSGRSILYINGNQFTASTVAAKVLSGWTVANASYPSIVLGGYLGDGCLQNDCALVGYMKLQRSFKTALPAAQITQLYNVDLSQL